MPLDSIAVLSLLDRATDADGNVVPGATLNFYEAGTLTAKTVYSDADLAVSLGAVVTCDAGGYPTSDGSAHVSIYTGSASYKLIVKDSDGVTVLTRDNIKGAPVIPTSSDTALPETPVVSKTTTYSIVEADQGKLINADPTGGSFALTLPSAVTVGDNWRIGVRHNGASTSNTVAVRSTGGQTIQGPGQTTATSISLSGLGQSFWFVSDGAGWTIDSSAEPFMAGGLPFLKITDRLTAPPSSPVGGQRYIINGTPTGVWATLSFAEKDVAESDGNGSWLKYTPADGWLAYVEDENTLTQYRDSAWTDLSNVTAPITSTLKYAVFEHQETNGTNGGTPTSAAWTKRTLNTEVSNTITGCSIAASVITLPVGTYRISAEGSFVQTAQTLMRIKVASGTATPTELRSSPRIFPTVDGAGDNLGIGTGLHFDGVLVVTAVATIELQYYVASATTNGLGLASTEPDDDLETYARVTILDLTSTQGPAGAQGAQGNEGLDAAYYYQWSTATSGDPGSGKIRGNNATIASITELAVSETDAAGASLAAVIASWDDSTSTTSKARLRIQKEGATQNFHEFRITAAGTDLGTYWTFAASYIGTGGTISNGNDVAVNVLQVGDIGDPGTVVPDISGLSEDTANDDEADFLIEYDTSAGSHKKVKPKNLGFTQAGTGAARRGLQAKLREVQFSAADFGVVCDASTDNTTNLQEAVDAAYAAVTTAFPSTGVARVYIPPGICLTGQITLRDRVLIGGDSPQACEIRAINGLDDDLFITPDFASLTGTNVWLAAEGVISFIGFYGCRINGNKANQSAGDVLKLYAKGLYFDEVIIYDGYGNGIYSETGEDPTVASWPTLCEGHTGHLQILNCGGHGWHNRGPHDLYAHKVTSLLNGGDGMRIESASGDYLATTDFAFLHCYANTGRGLTVVDSGGIKIGIARLEDNHQEGLYYDNADNCLIGVLSLFDNCRTSGSYQGVIDADSQSNVIAEFTSRTVGRAAAGGFQLLGVGNRVSGVIQGDVAGGGFSTGVGFDMPTGALYCHADINVSNFSGVGGIALRTANGGAIQFNHVNARLLGSTTLWENATQGAMNHYDIIGNCTAAQTKFTGQQPTTGATREIWNVQLRDENGNVFFWGTPLLLDSNGTHSLGFQCGSNLTDHRILTLTPGDANRTLDISAADVTISSAAAGVLDDTSVRAMCATLRTPYVLGQSAVAASHTGDTNETVLATITVPAGAIGANGRLRIITAWTTTNDASNKTYRVRLGGIGGTAFSAAVLASIASLKVVTEIANRNAANSQVGGPANYTGVGGSAAAFVTGAIDTASAQDIVITGELADGADTITLKSYSVELIYGA